MVTFDGNDTAEFSGLNVHINNGSGTTFGEVDGLGNLIVGYNETNSDAPKFCTDIQYGNEVDCIANSETWVNNVHTGSHNIVVGRGQSFPSYGGLVSGVGNAIINNYGSATGGRYNVVSGYISSISGGYNNAASGIYSSVSGGDSRTAIGEDEWVAGSLSESN